MDGVPFVPTVVQTLPRVEVIIFLGDLIMRDWMTQLISRVECETGISVVAEIKNMLWDGRSKAYVVNALRKSVMLHCDAKYAQDPSYAERALLATMVNEGLTTPPDRREGRVLFEPPRLAERRALVSKNLHVAVPEDYELSLAWSQTTGYRVNEEMLGLLMSCNLLEEWESDEAIRVVSENDGIFYLDCFMDFRGRIYTNHYGSLSPQANQNVRAMVDFRDPVAVDVDSESYRMLLDVLDDEFSVNYSNYNTILKKAESLLMEKTYGKKTAGVIRAALCLKEIATTGASSYIVQQDATCSGFQHMAGVLRDTDLGSLVNLTPGDRTDLYLATVDFMCEQATAVGKFLASFERSIVRSELAKPTVMLTGYGSTAEALALAYLGYTGDAKFVDKSGEEVFATRFKDVETAVKQGSEVHFYPDQVMSKWLRGLTGVDAMKSALAFAREFQAGLFAIAPAAQVLLDAVKGAAQSYYNSTGRTFSWSTPLGLNIQLPNWKVSEDTTLVQYQSKSGRKSMKVLKLNLDTQGGAAGALPNLMHSLDACLVHKVNLLRMERGLPWADIHDSFGSTIADVALIHELINEAFIWVHQNFDINTVLRDHHRPCLTKGDLDLSSIEQIVF